MKYLLSLSLLVACAAEPPVEEAPVQGDDAAFINLEPGSRCAWDWQCSDGLVYTHKSEDRCVDGKPELRYDWYQGVGKCLPREKRCAREPVQLVPDTTKWVAVGEGVPCSDPDFDTAPGR